MCVVQDKEGLGSLQSHSTLQALPKGRGRNSQGGNGFPGSPAEDVHVESWSRNVDGFLSRLGMQEPKAGDGEKVRVQNVSENILHACLR